MLNNLSSDLNIMRPSMLETGLESVSYNLNRKNNNLKFFEFGKTYKSAGSGKYEEKEHLCLYITGDATEQDWKNKAQQADIFLIKGIVETVLKLLGLTPESFEIVSTEKFSDALQAIIDRHPVLTLGT